MPEPFDSAFDRIPGSEAYPRDSRYYGTEIGVYTLPDGTAVRYAKRRILPALPDPEDVRGHIVSAGERPDLLGQAYFGDPEQWWRVADLNPVLDPRELTAEPGHVIAVPPEGA